MPEIEVPYVPIGLVNAFTDAKNDGSARPHGYATRRGNGKKGHYIILE